MTLPTVTTPILADEPLTAQSVTAHTPATFVTPHARPMNAITLLATALGAITLWASAGAACAQENRLGRLFYTPQERQQLDQRRGVVAAPASTAPQTVIVNGMVVRQGQAPIHFIDGKESTGSSGGTAQQQLNRGVPLKTESGQTIAAKPGQIVDLANGRAMETYQLIPGIADITPKDAAPTAESAVPAAGTPGTVAAKPQQARNTQLQSR